MKILLAILATMMAYKYAGDSVVITEFLNNYKELIAAAALTFASKPLLKRIFG